MGADRYLEGSRVGGVDELVMVLRHWLAQEAPPDTVGDLRAVDRRTPVLRGEVDGQRLVLHADTTQEAVRHIVAAPVAGWRVVANQRGRINLVLPPGDEPSLAGWYCYLLEPRVRPGPLTIG